MSYSRLSLLQLPIVLGIVRLAYLQCIDISFIQ